MFSEELTSQSGRKFGGAPGATVHVTVNGRRVFDYAGDFGIMIAELRTVIQIG